MSTALEAKIDAVLARACKMVLATSVGGMSSSASVFFAHDGEDFLFFTFTPTRKARQVRFNPRVQMSIWPAGDDGIRGLRVEGYCSQIKSAAEILHAREKILAVSDAFQQYMDDEFLCRNGVIGYYRIRPTRITHIDFYADSQFETLDFAHNRRRAISEAVEACGNWLLLWIQAMRAPFFTATLIPVLLGATIARGDLSATGQVADWDWGRFGLVLLGALAAHAGTNLANDYGDHLSGNDEVNRVPSPFNGGSRVIQAGLIAPWKVLWASMLCFAVAVGIGLGLNHALAGSALAPTPLLAVGLAGCVLGAGYTLGPLRLGYRGLGEIAIALGFGPLIVLGAHYVLSEPLPGGWNWAPPLLASAPVAVFVAMIVWINQFQDVPADRLVGKRNWVERCAPERDGRIVYERPLTLYSVLGIAGFSLVALLGATGWIDPRLGTLYALIALLPLPLLIYAHRLGWAWLEDWNRADADRARLPYELLKVNAITIGIHFSTGLLLVLAYSLRDPV